MSKLKLNPKADKNCSKCLGTGTKMEFQLFAKNALKHIPCDCKRTLSFITRLNLSLPFLLAMLASFPLDARF